MELWKKAALFIYAFLFNFCCTVDLVCMVKRNGTRMVYNISLESHASGLQPARCDSSWSNKTTVLSTSSDKHPDSLHTLETSDCHVYISWMAQCWSEGKELIDYTANCTTTCAVMNLGQVGDSKILIYPIFGVLLFLGILGLILSYIFKANICRMLTFVRRIYSPVSKQNDAEPPDVVMESQ